jgi:hypothetical protein
LRRALGALLTRNVGRFTQTFAAFIEAICLHQTSIVGHSLVVQESTFRYALKMQNYLDDIYTEPSAIDVQTLSNLGPLSPMAGIWQGIRGIDVKPKADGAKTQSFVERIELHPMTHLLMGHNFFTDCAITRTSPNQTK